MLPILARADSIPAKIEVDTTGWNIHDLFKVEELSMPPGVTVQLDAKQTLASIVPGRAEEEEEEKTDEEEAIEDDAEGEKKTEAEGADAKPAK
jgi:hypothetical protein